jgi:hypothetical protein
VPKKEVRLTDPPISGALVEGPTVLLIASDNRSGSTLLDLLLGSGKGYCSSGELRRFDELYDADEVCTCGDRLVECPFWNAVLAREGETVAKTASTRAPKGKRLLSVASLLIRGRVKRDAVTERYWRRIVAIGEVANADVVVDSSKMPDHLALVLASPGCRAAVIHLVRDGRAVAYSKGQRTGTAFWRAATSWLLTNLQILRVLRAHPNVPTVRIRYEDLCRDVTGTLSSALETLGLSYDERMSVLQKDGRHNLGGSPHRFEKSDIDVRLDTRWQSAVTPRMRRQFVFFGWLNRTFGYP